MDSGGWRLSGEECTHEYEKCEAKPCPSKKECRTWGGGQSGSPENPSQETVTLDYHSSFILVTQPLLGVSHYSLCWETSVNKKQPKLPFCSHVEMGHRGRDQEIEKFKRQEVLNATRLFSPAHMPHPIRSFFHNHRQWPVVLNLSPFLDL